MARILVVDDDMLVQELVKDMLEIQGHDVVLACDGAEALELQVRYHADLVVTDMVMPRKDGIELIQELQQQDPCIKIIAMSGCGREEAQRALRRALVMGVQRTFVKPLDMKSFLGAISEVLG